jgi:hypothetical protein
MRFSSPYPQRRGALTDIQKLRDSGLDGGKAIVIYGYDYDDYPMSLMMDCFENLAGENLQTQRHISILEGLIHPIHSRGEVHGWLVT